MLLGYIVLIAIQFAAAFVGGPFVLKYVPVSGDLQNFVLAASYAVIVWIVGLVGSFVLKDVNLPTSRTLASALVGALIGAVIMLFPVVLNAIPFKFPPLYLPLIGAIIGYMVRR